MARPVGANAVETKRRLLEAAAEHFALRGDNASLRAIARDAGVSLAAIYHFFGTKDRLLGACREQLYGRLRGELDPLSAVFRAAS